MRKGFWVLLMLFFVVNLLWSVDHGFTENEVIKIGEYNGYDWGDIAALYFSEDDTNCYFRIDYWDFDAVDFAEFSAEVTFAYMPESAGGIPPFPQPVEIKILSESIASLTINNSAHDELITDFSINYAEKNIQIQMTKPENYEDIITSIKSTSNYYNYDLLEEIEGNIGETEVLKLSVTNEFDNMLSNNEDFQKKCAIISKLLKTHNENSINGDFYISGQMLKLIKYYKPALYDSLDALQQTCYINYLFSAYGTYVMPFLPEELNTFAIYYEKMLVNFVAKKGERIAILPFDAYFTEGDHIENADFLDIFEQMGYGSVILVGDIHAPDYDPAKIYSSENGMNILLENSDLSDAFQNKDLASIVFNAVSNSTDEQTKDLNIARNHFGVGYDIEDYDNSFYEKVLGYSNIFPWFQVISLAEIIDEVSPVETIEITEGCAEPFGGNAGFGGEGNLWFDNWYNCSPRAYITIADNFDQYGGYSGSFRSYGEILELYFDMLDNSDFGGNQYLREYSYLTFLDNFYAAGYDCEENFGENPLNNLYSVINHALNVPTMLQYIDSYPDNHLFIEDINGDSSSGYDEVVFDYPGYFGAISEFTGGIIFLYDKLEDKIILGNSLVPCDDIEDYDNDYGIMRMSNKRGGAFLDGYDNYNFSLKYYPMYENENDILLSNGGSESIHKKYTFYPNEKYIRVDYTLTSEAPAIYTNMLASPDIMSLFYSESAPELMEEMNHCEVTNDLTDSKVGFLYPTDIPVKELDETLYSAGHKFDEYHIVPGYKNAMFLYWGDISVSQIDSLQTVMETDIEKTPKKFYVGNYPNPFNPETVIEYSIPTDADVVIEVYNIVGQKIDILVNERKKSGKHSVLWKGKDNNGKSVASGVYFYKIKADNHQETKRMLLVK